MTKSDLTFRSTKGRPLTHSEHDANFDRLLYAQASWVSGQTYTPNELVFHEGGLWYCLATTTGEPTSSNPSWLLYSPNTGIGQQSLSTPTPGNSWGAGWDPLNYFDTGSGLGVTMDTALGTLTFDWPGIWRVELQVGVAHNESNGGREVDIRTFNVTTATPGTPDTFFIGRNQPGSNLTYASNIVITDTELGQAFRFEIGGGDSVTSVNYSRLVLDVWQLTPRQS